MTRHDILLHIAAGLVGLLALSACVREDWNGDGQDGPGIRFKVSTTYDNGEPEDETETKTVYSGERVSLTYMGSTQKYERIDWTAGDKILIHSAQAISPRGDDVTYEVTTDGDAAGKNSTAPAVPEADPSGRKDGFAWADPDVLHHFFAVYPSTGLTLTVGEGISGDTGDDIATVSGSVPQSQTATKNDKGDVLEYEPDMGLVAMAAYSQRLGAASEVPLHFKPLVTAVRFTLLGHADDAVTRNGSGYKLTKLRLSSSSVDSGSDKAPRMWGKYKVAFGKYDTHNGIPPIYTDPSDPSTMTDPGTTQTFSGGRGINNGLHDIDGEDNAFALLSAEFPTGTPFSVAENYVEITVPDAGGIALSETKPTAFTFLCLPQTQTHLSLELTFSNGSDTKTRTLKLQHESSWISLKGHYKTYFDALPVRRPEYHLIVTSQIGDFPTSAHNWSNYFTVKSYHDKAGGQEPVKWTAEFSTEGDLPEKYKAAPPAWLSRFYTGSEHVITGTDYQAVPGNTDSDGAKSYTVGLAENAAVNHQLAEAGGEKSGSAAKADAPDLSFRDVYGVTYSTRETANCYVVRGQGYYKFPAVYGNAIMNGVTNSAAYTGKPSTLAEYSTNILQTFLRHDNNPISGPWIKDNGITIASASLVWQDAPNLITDVSFDSDYIYFNVQGNQEGNAVIAAKDAGGNIVWSWHIWCLSNPDLELSTVCLEINPEFQSDVGHNHVLHSNLGFVRGATASADERVCHVRFRQVKDDGTAIPEGATAYMVISQMGSEAGSRVTFYQWGRKDPMFPSTLESTSPVTVRDSRIYGNGSTWLYSGEEFPTPHGSKYTGTGGIGNAIKNPEKFYTMSNGVPKADPLEFWGYRDVYFNLWNSNVTQPVRRTGSKSDPSNDDWNFNRKDIVVQKTVYDPCPPGFCVPNEYAFTIFSTYRQSGSSNSGGHYPGSLMSSINAAILSGVAGSNDAEKKKNSFNKELGYTFFTTSDGENRTHGRVFMRAVGRRNGNAGGTRAQLQETPINLNSAYGTYWTATPYLFIGGTKRWVYARTFRFGRTYIHGVFGSGSEGDTGFLTAHGHPVRPVWDKDSDRNDTNHGHLY